MINRHILELTDSTSNGNIYPLSHNHFISITDDGTGIAPALAAKLQALRYRAEVTATISAASDVVILLQGLRQFSDVTEVLNAEREAFQQARIIAERFTVKGGLFITVQNTGGRFGLVDCNELAAWSGGLAGLTKTASQEWPRSVCRAIDIERKNKSAEQLAEKLLQEILTGHHIVECGLLANDKRLSLKLLQQSVTPAKFNFDKKSVILVSGGARGVTAACVIELAKQVPARFVLLGRTELTVEPSSCQGCNTEAELRQRLVADYQQQNKVVNPKQINQEVAQILAVREIKHTLQALTDVGADAQYQNVDVLNLTQLTDLLKQVRKQWGKITGVIHGAGVLADKLIAQQTDEQFDKVFRTKVYGLQNLLQATASDPLNLLILFSSVAGRFGNPGQVAYAMANEILNKVAQAEHQRRGAKCLVKSINWGPWESGMVNAALKAVFLERGVDILPLQQGVEMFVQELSAKERDQVEVICGGTLVQAQKKTEENQVAAQLANYSSHYNVSEATHPYLNSHAIKGLPVLPACLVLEWFLRTAQESCPTLKVYACEDFKVLRGIRLTEFSQAAQEFTVQTELQSQTNNQVILNVSLLDKTGFRCYSAKVLLQPNLPNIDKSLSADIGNDAWPWRLNEIYADASQAGVLFHGPDFQAVRSLDTFSNAGGTAHLIGLLPLHWPMEMWQVDVAALDGALQLLLLWGAAILKQKTLPTSIARVTRYTEKPYMGVLKCVFNCQAHGSYRLVADIILLQENNQVYAAMQGVEMCVAQI